MIRVAICDDDTFFCSQLYNFLMSNFSSYISEIDDFSNGNELFSEITNNHSIYDFIFLDLKIGDSDLEGISTGVTLRKLTSHMNCVIFLCYCI